MFFKENKIKSNLLIDVWLVKIGKYHNKFILNLMDDFYCPF